MWQKNQKKTRHFQFLVSNVPPEEEAVRLGRSEEEKPNVKMNKKRDKQENDAERISVKLESNESKHADSIVQPDRETTALGPVKTEIVKAKSAAKWQSTHVQYPCALCKEAVDYTPSAVVEHLTQHHSISDTSILQEVLNRHFWTRVSLSSRRHFWIRMKRMHKLLCVLWDVVSSSIHIRH